MIQLISKMLYVQLVSVLELGRISFFFSVKSLVFSKSFDTSKALAIAVVALLLMLCGCSAPSWNANDITWKTYKNSRYSFEFPYPSSWQTSTVPTNDDGVAFVSPKNHSVEIRAWASNQLPKTIRPNLKTPMPQETNFQTTQGIKGQLAVEVGNTVSTMILTLNQNQVRYHWQGKSPSQEFPTYYPLFYYIAQQYRISQ